MNPGWPGRKVSIDQGARVDGKRLTITVCGAVAIAIAIGAAIGVSVAGRSLCGLARWAHLGGWGEGRYVGRV